jgi:N-acetylglucosamine-6-phosphate deacetylase
MRLGVRAALVDGRLVTGDVELEGARVAGVGLATRGGDGIAAPGLVDLQVNGIPGVCDFQRGEYERAAGALLEGGTTAVQPTVITGPEAEMAAALGAVPPRIGAVKVFGAHLEGPFISELHLGAHPGVHRRDPDLELLRRLLDAGPVRHVTLAPELPRAGRLMDELVLRDVTIALGHSGATAAQAHAAFDRGATTVTHLFNAMSTGTHRAPGLALAALARQRTLVTMIADPHHLADEALLTAWNAAGGRLALVSDASGPTLGGHAKPEPPALAGSDHLLLDGVRRLHALGVPLERAVAAASAVPAVMARRPDLGRLAPLSTADVLVLDDRLEVQRVLVDGEDVL